MGWVICRHSEGTKIKDYLDSTVCAIYSWVIPSMKTFSNVVFSIFLTSHVSAWYCLIAIDIVAVEIHMIIISRSVAGKDVVRVITRGIK